MEKAKCKKCKKKSLKILISRCKKCSKKFCNKCIFYRDHNCPKSEEFEKLYRNELKEKLVDAKFKKINRL